MYSEKLSTNLQISMTLLSVSSHTIWVFWTTHTYFIGLLIVLFFIYGSRPYISMTLKNTKTQTSPTRLRISTTGESTRVARDRFLTDSLCAAYGCTTASGGPPGLSSKGAAQKGRIKRTFVAVRPLKLSFQVIFWRKIHQIWQQWSQPPLEVLLSYGVFLEGK